MSDLYRIDENAEIYDGDLLAEYFQAYERSDRIVGRLVPVGPDRMIEVRLERSEPTPDGRYKITLTSDQPANSLTMHGTLFVIGGDDG